MSILASFHGEQQMDTKPIKYVIELESEKQKNLLAAVKTLLGEIRWDLFESNQTKETILKLAGLILEGAV